MTAEQIYDEKIAPLLLEAGRIAQENGIDFLACVDIADDNKKHATATTRCINMGTAHAVMRLVYFAISAKGNVDLMMFRVLKDQQDKPHNSVVLQMLEHAKSVLGQGG